jgi:hypothetical protein
MYSFAQRPDIQVVDEPFFGLFLQRYPEVYRPSREEVMTSMPLEEQAVLLNLKSSAQENKSIFLKNMVNHWPLVNWETKKNWQHVFLFRDPHPVIASFSKQVKHPQLFDLGYAEQLNAIMELEQAGIPFYLLQSEAILQNPRGELEKLCQFLNIPFSNSMLSWPAAARPEDGLWAKYWYHKVHDSTNFATYQSKQYTLPAHLEALAQEATLHYNKILSYL